MLHKRAACLDPASRQQPHGGGCRRSGRDDAAAEPGERPKKASAHGSGPHRCSEQKNVQAI